MEPGRLTGGSVTLMDASPDAMKQLQLTPELGARQVDRHTEGLVAVLAPHVGLAGRRVQKEHALVADPVRLRLVATEQVPDGWNGAAFEHDDLLGLVVTASAHQPDGPTRFAADLMHQRLDVDVLDV